MNVRYCMSKDCGGSMARPMLIGPSRGQNEHAVELAYAWSCPCGAAVSATREEYVAAMGKPIQRASLVLDDCDVSVTFLDGEEHGQATMWMKVATKLHRAAEIALNMPFRHEAKP